MLPGQTLFQPTSRILAGLETVLANPSGPCRHRPGRHDNHIVRRVSGILPAIAVGHVEAGLRNDDCASRFQKR